MDSETSMFTGLILFWAGMCLHWQGWIQFLAAIMSRNSIVRLGGIPGPIAFGSMIDKSCLLWQNQCGEQGSCYVYQNFAMSRYTLVVGLVYKVISKAHLLSSAENEKMSSILFFTFLHSCLLCSALLFHSFWLVVSEHFQNFSLEEFLLLSCALVEQRTHRILM